MNNEAVIARLEQYRADFELHDNSFTKEMICQQLLGFLSALSYTDLPYPILKYWGDTWQAMSAEVTNMIYSEGKKNDNV